MSFYTEHAKTFSCSVSETLQAMLGLSSEVSGIVLDTESPASAKNFHIAIYFTGMVYGEYILSLSESDAAPEILFWGVLPGSL